MLGRVSTRVLSFYFKGVRQAEALLPLYIKEPTREPIRALKTSSLLFILSLRLRGRCLLILAKLNYIINIRRHLPSNLKEGINNKEDVFSALVGSLVGSLVYKGSRALARLTPLK